MPQGFAYTRRAFMLRCSLQPTDSALSQALSGELGISRVLATLLAGRVADVDAARRFLSPSLDQLHSPWLMLGMSAAVERIERAIAGQERILIYGDYDVDGATSVVILRKALQMLGADAAFYIPHRLNDGYGMRAAVIERVAAEGVRLVISVDTGIRAGAVVERATALGVDVIITDHHLPEDTVPRAVAVLNPHQQGCDYPDKALSGVGVAFKLVQALFERSGRVPANACPPVLEAFLKIVAIGTIADSVPLTGENRVFAHFGLRGLRRPVNPGLQALIETVMTGKEALNAEDIAFRLAPRLNAAGRMADADRVIQLFSSAAGDAGELASALDRLNQERQQVESAIRAELEARLLADRSLDDDPVLVLDGEGWHRGVIGIVANRICERYRRPTLVISRENGSAHGSGRAPAGVPLLRMLESCPDLFERFGGHAQAVGFAMRSENIPAFRARVNAYAREIGVPVSVEPVVEAHMELALDEITPQLWSDLERLEPFGRGNPIPVFFTPAARLAAHAQVLKERHVKFTLAGEGGRFDALGWGMASDHPDLTQLPAGAAVDIAYTVEYSRSERYGDRLQLILKRVAPASQTVAAAQGQ